MQKIRESERETLLEELKGKVGQMVSGVIWRFANRNLIVDIGKTEAILPVSEQVFRERFNLGQHVRAVIVKAEKSAARARRSSFRAAIRTWCAASSRSKCPRSTRKSSRSSTSCAKPGMRTKVAVVSHNPKVDPVGACVGVKGARVKPIIEELQGERIDLIPFSTDVSKYIASSLSPAKVVGVSILSAEEKRAEVLVADDMLSLAIGKNGHNVRLAAKLPAGISTSNPNRRRNRKAQEKSAATTETLTQLDGIGPKTAEVLTKAGLTQIERLAAMHGRRPDDAAGHRRKNGRKDHRIGEEIPRRTGRAAEESRRKPPKEEGTEKNEWMTKEE